LDAERNAVLAGIRRKAGRRIVRWTGRCSGVVDLTGGCGTRYGMSWDVTGQPGWERKASGRCEVPRGLRDVTVCRMMLRDVA